MKKAKLGLIIAGILAALFLAWWLLSYVTSGEAKPSGIYRIAIDRTWQTVQLNNREQSVTNFSEELALAIAEQQEFKMMIVNSGPHFLYSGLVSGNYDGILSSLPNSSREFIHSNPYLPLGPIVVAPTASKIQTIKDLRGKKIGFIMGTESNIPLYKETSVHFIPYDYSNLSKLIDDILDNNIDGAILKGMLAFQYAKRGLYQQQLKIVSPPLNDEGLALIATNTPESKKLIQMFNDGLKALQEKGTYNQLLQRWDLPVPKDPVP